MSSIFSAFKIAFRALSAQKIRTGLAVLGVMVGMTSVIIVFSAGEGIRGLVVLVEEHLVILGI